MTQGAWIQYSNLKDPYSVPVEVTLLHVQMCSILCPTSSPDAKGKRGDQYCRVTSLLIRKQEISGCTSMKGKYLQRKEE